MLETQIAATGESPALVSARQRALAAFDQVAAAYAASR